MSMGPILSLTEAAGKYRMIPIGKCNCGGYPTEKFSDGTYTLHWRKTKYLFKLTNKNNTVKDWTPVSQLVDFLASHFKKENKFDEGREN